ncbi:MAG: S8 family serine peptidase [Ferruginibacter sp.]
MKNFPKVLLTSSRKEALLDNSRLLLAFKKPTTAKEVATLAKEFNLVLEDFKDRKGSKKHWQEINHSPTHFWVKSGDGTEITEEKYQNILAGLKSKLDWIGPVYMDAQQQQSESRFCPFPNVLLIEKSEKQKGRQDEIIKSLKLAEVPEKSKYLSRYRYLTVANPLTANAYQLRNELSKSASVTGSIRFENMPMIKPLTTTIPNDTLFTDQWNMTQVNAPQAWDISTGSGSVVICILDEGCDLTHPDLQFSENGINLGTMMPTGAPTGNHGTACAGIAAATFDNNEGVAGLAGNCLIMPLAFSGWTDVQCASGINYASTNGASVISMSFGVYDGWGWDYTIIDPEIQNAFANDVVMCAATGNENDGSTNRYPGRHPLIIAVGGSSTDDNRKTPASPDGECWGANFGEDVYNGITTGVSVVAPCVQCPTTDRQGANGYNNNGSLINNPWACVSYPAQVASGNYLLVFDGTSAATPHVAGLAGLIRSQYPLLSNTEVRNIIERTAAKVGTLAYADNPAFGNGTRNQEMGYGRIDAFRGLDFADVMIKDWSGDNGAEPGTIGNWWSYSDIVVRITDDNLFEPSDPAKSKHVERGQTNYIYIKVTNNGPNDARNVAVDFRITPYVGLEFVYPNDWTLEDGMHVKPTPVTAAFASIPSGSSAIAKFTISAAQTEALYGWQYVNPWHPCLLAMVTADNDYAFATSDLSFGNLVLRKNNIAQRNLSVIDVLATAARAVAVSSPFVAGNLANMETTMFIEVDRSKVPSLSKVFLSLDDDGNAFPLVDFTNAGSKDDKKPSGDTCGCKDDSLVFLNRTLIKTRFGCCDGLLTLEKGSVLEFSCTKEQMAIRNIKGGHLLVENGRRFIEATGDKLLVEVQKEPGTIFPVSVRTVLPAGLAAGDQYTLSVSQQNGKQQTVGGADTVYIVKA